MIKSCTFWNRQKSRGEKSEMDDISFKLLDKVYDKWNYEDKKDPPCRECKVCKLADSDSDFWNPIIKVQA